MAYRCPLCEYTADSKSAVGAHVSSKIDDVHKGEFGSGVEDQIVATDGGAPESGVDTASSGFGGDEPLPSTDGAVGVPPALLVALVGLLALWVVFSYDRRRSDRQGETE